MLPVNAGSVKDLISQKQLSTVAIVGFQFGLYHVVSPLSFLRCISLASLFTKVEQEKWKDAFCTLSSRHFYLFDSTGVAENSVKHPLVTLT